MKIVVLLNEIAGIKKPASLTINKDAGPGI